MGGRADRRTGGRADGRADGRTGGWMGGQADGRADRRTDGPWLAAGSGHASPGQAKPTSFLFHRKGAVTVVTVTPGGEGGGVKGV